MTFWNDMKQKISLRNTFVSIVLADTPLFWNGSRYIGDETNFFLSHLSII